jgi:hypothetical protein
MMSPLKRIGGLVMALLEEMVREVLYRLVSHVFHQPRLLRLFSAALRRSPLLHRLMPAPFIASRAGVNAVVKRTADFSHTSYAKILAAGDFVIGMDGGPTMAGDRSQLLKWIRQAGPDFGAASSATSRRLISGFRATGKHRIDLVEDYLLWVVWSELDRLLGPFESRLAGSGPEDRNGLRNRLEQLRYLGANLVVGWVAPGRVREKVARYAQALKGDVAEVAARLDPGHPGGHGDTALRRNVIGMLWVGHPATVQAGALVIQELFSRPTVHRQLSDQAQGLGDKAWDDLAFRVEVKSHIIELLRFRPVFPFVPRVALRDMFIGCCDGLAMPVKAGRHVVAAIIGAMFDPQAVWAPEVYHPGRYREGWGREPEDELLMFSLGERDCVARHVVPEILVSATIGLLTLPGLRWPERRLLQSRITYDGVIITAMPVVFDPLG